MVILVYWLPIGGFLAQADWLDAKVGGHWCCFCNHLMIRVNSCSALKYDDSAINKV